MSDRKMAAMYVEYIDKKGSRQRFEIKNLFPHEAKIMHSQIRAAAKSNEHIRAFGCYWNENDLERSKGGGIRAFLLRMVLWLDSTNLYKGDK